MDLNNLVNAAAAKAEAAPKEKIDQELERVVSRVERLDNGGHNVFFIRADGKEQAVYVKPDREVPEIGEKCLFRIYVKDSGAKQIRYAHPCHYLKEGEQEGM